MKRAREKWCLCKGLDDGRLMIECSKCFEWFHYNCVGLSGNYSRKMEKFKWFCPKCSPKVINSLNKHIALQEKHLAWKEAVCQELKEEIRFLGAKKTAIIPAVNKSVSETKINMEEESAVHGLVVNEVNVVTTVNEVVVEELHEPVADSKSDSEQQSTLDNSVMIGEGIVKLIVNTPVADTGFNSEQESPVADTGFNSEQESPVAGTELNSEQESAKNPTPIKEVHQHQARPLFKQRKTRLSFKKK